MCCPAVEECGRPRSGRRLVPRTVSPNEPRQFLGRVAERAPRFNQTNYRRSTPLIFSHAAARDARAPAPAISTDTAQFVNNKYHNQLYILFLSAKREDRFECFQKYRLTTPSNTTQIVIFINASLIFQPLSIFLYDKYYFKCDNRKTAPSIY